MDLFHSPKGRIGDISSVLDPSGFGFVAGPFMRLQASRKRTDTIKKYDIRILFIRILYSIHSNKKM
jgi:hypothetical protein